MTQSKEDNYEEAIYKEADLRGNCLLGKCSQEDGLKLKALISSAEMANLKLAICFCFVNNDIGEENGRQKSN